jgi:hypothetical protein
MRKVSLHYLVKITLANAPCHTSSESATASVERVF